MRFRALLLLGLLPAVSPAAPWDFGKPIDVAPAPAAGVFHHLESAGRRSLAAGGGWVALAWEDNRSGAPQAYVALKPADAARFDAPRVLSTGKQAFEPAVAALGSGRFVAVWEQDDEVWVRAIGPKVLGPPQRLAGPGANQASVTAHDGIALAVWSERSAGGHAAIRLARLEMDSPDRPLRIAKPRTVDPAPPKADQIYPSVAANAGGVTVAWEDRRHGHTVLLYTHAPLRSLRFVAPHGLNEQPPRRSATYGRGPGAARVGLVERGGGVAAVWLDKRDFTSGYDVYAALSPDGKRFGRNEKVQDEFGNAISQWHAAIAADRSGRIAVVWNDDRDETADLWLSWREGEDWSADEALPGASGPGSQSSPMAAFDDAGNLHLAWIEQADADSPTRLRYMRGVPRGGP